MDILVDYKEEAIKAFVNIVELGKNYDQAEAEPVPTGKKGEPAPEVEEKPVLGATFNQLLNKIGNNRLDNVLATFAIEYAESRGNLNKEQAFFYLALYQYALSRQNLKKIYMNATVEKHPDV